MAAVLDRMVRLSYYDNVIQKTDKVTSRPQPLAHVVRCTRHDEGRDCIACSLNAIAAAVSDIETFGAHMNGCMRTRLIQTFTSPQGIAPLLPPKPEAAPLPGGAADGAMENGDATSNVQLAEQRRAAEMVALVRCRPSGLAASGTASCSTCVSACTMQSHSC